jgi:hypothetical protein
MNTSVWLNECCNPVCAYTRPICINSYRIGWMNGSGKRDLFRPCVANVNPMHASSQYSMCGPPYKGQSTDSTGRYDTVQDGRHTNGHRQASLRPIFSGVPTIHVRIRFGLRGLCTAERNQFPLTKKGRWGSGGKCTSRRPCFSFDSPVKRL